MRRYAARHCAEHGSTLFITHDKFWQKFCREAGRPQWSDDPMFATMASRRQNREAVLAETRALRQVFRRKRDMTDAWY